MLKIPSTIYDKMIKHCQSELPNEACGILGGKENIITEIYCMENIEKSPESFLMNPKEQIRVIKELRDKELDMKAIYHSHPFSPARPSKKDIDMAFYDKVYYLIISFSSENPEIKVFSIVNKKAEEIAFEIVTRDS